ncbi:hypothetical protein C8T65DRAFT_48130 [Cerioporus squamosus]|nr:hypothetical protein C8T65DRAFT_48130 [Cerioporus squamosus]
MSPSHAVLCNSDILLLVFEALEDILEPEGVKRRRAQLAQCVRVCKAFEYPAARVLWARLPHIFPLLKLCEPSIDCVGQGRRVNDVEVPVYILWQEIKISEWERFRRYARLVRVIAADPDPERFDGDYENGNEPVVISAAIWTFLARRNAYQPLLPAIRYLEWEIGDPANTELLYLVAPTLQRLHLRFRQIETIPDEEWFFGFRPYFCSVIKLTPLLTHLTKSCKNVPVLELQWNMSDCKGVVDLRVLELEYNNADYAIDHNLIFSHRFLELEHLEDLKLGVSHYTLTSEWPPVKAREIVHPNLKSLTFADYSGEAEIYQVFVTPQLRSLTIIYRVSVDIPSVRSACAVIVRQFPNLTAIRIEFRPDWLKPVEHADVLTSAIEPLFALRNIQEASFALRATNDIIVTNADVAAFVAAWPKLRSLSLEQPCYRGPLSPGIPALVSVARSGTKMSTLYLSHLYLCSADLSAARKEGSVPCNPSLDILRVGEVLNELGDEFPAFCDLADALFPNRDAAHKWAPELHCLQGHRS